MTLPTTPIKQEFSGDGSTILFPITDFGFFAGEEEVTHIDALGVETAWASGTQYTLVQKVAGTTANLTVITTPTNYTPLINETLRVRRKTLKTQGTDLLATNDGPIERAIDRLAMALQEIDERVDRAMRRPIGGTNGSSFYDAESNKIENVDTPTAATDAANKAYADAAITGPAGPPGPQGPAGDLDGTIFDANTILKADTDNTPVALTVPVQTLLGRITAGNITALTPAQARTVIGAASLIAQGVVELATIAETDTGTDATRAVTPDGLQGSKRNIRYLCFHLVDKDTFVAVGTAIGGDFTIPFAGTILQDDTLHDQLAAVTDVAGTTGTMVVDIHKNGTTIMTTNKLDIETAEKGTQTATTQPDLTTTAIAAGDILTFDIDAIHTTAAKGLKVLMAIRES